MQRFTWPDPPRQTAYPIARPGWPFIGAAAFATLVLALLGMKVAAVAMLIVAACICAFFRDPDRAVPQIDGGVVSPADGKIIICEKVAASDFYEGECLKISIFMSVFNVHVNRMVCDGRISDVAYHPGKFFSANLDKASRENEHNALYVDTPSGQRLVVVQIAGLIARRIICGAQAGDELVRGQRFGMICFGSRLDVYLPPDARPDVHVGQKVRAGASLLGFLD
ncbi:MAG: phosphatidylserine decarboxylase family protein [Desulfobacterales bacterium]|nr:phosphatidylserine decarboxylase family protein [Desulfobacterales bacterium]